MSDIRSGVRTHAGGDVLHGNYDRRDEACLRARGHKKGSWASWSAYDGGADEHDENRFPPTPNSPRSQGKYNWVEIYQEMVFKQIVRTLTLRREDGEDTKTWVS